MNRYDGWCLKNTACRNPFLATSYFREKKIDVIKHFEAQWMEKGAWRKQERMGRFKIVKVKLVEVE